MLRVSRIIAVALCLGSFVSADTNNHCGGVVKVGVNYPAIITYKLNEEYDNDEQCVWTIRIDDFESHALRFIKKESNFEQRYDFLQLSGFRDTIILPSETRTLGNVNTEEVVNITAPVVFMTFSSDDSGTGTGFTMEIEAVGNGPYNYFHMDYFSEEPVGVTSLEPYYLNMKTTWVITANNVSSLELGINFDTHFNYDIISVFHLERNGGRILFFPYGLMSGTGNRYYTVRSYTTFVVIFQSDSRDEGHGSVKLDWTTGKDNKIV